MTTRQGRPRTRVAVFACVALVALVIDQLTKFWAQIALSDGRTVPVVPPLLSLTLVHNPGASLGLGSSMTWVISLLAIIASIVLVVLGLRTASTRWSVMFALAFAGAFGNLIDRVTYADGFLNGKVVDFLNYGWSVGNVADIWLMIAGIGIVVLIMLGTPIDHEDNAATAGVVTADDGSGVDSNAVAASFGSDAPAGADGRDASKGGAL
ncbi:MULTISPECIES: signal peptidase II [Bifidobacterium]|uniref:signal peptidase II n=1 Tax=Bifidobacterium TaxID=1678 RepID=UPI001BDCE0A6|nr:MULTISPECIES: signal peptidase II [Bifidobacterium]MBT1161114.1 signal peptidase II [Bifidobacterium sp. SO1]MBW3078188.1 signal peptidase II [Bifidobacterium simiiventris]